MNPLLNFNTGNFYYDKESKQVIKITKLEEGDSEDKIPRMIMGESQSTKEVIQYD